MSVTIGTGWLACVGDDPAGSHEGGPPVGDYGGKCFEDRKCKEGLVCVDGLLCVRPGESVDSGAGDDGRAPDATSEEDATSDGGAECGVLVLPTNNPYVPCLKEGTPSSCTAALPVCCVGSKQTRCTEDAPTCTATGNVAWTCSKTTQCLSDTECCVRGGLTPAPANACGVDRYLQTAGEGSACMTACGSSSDMVELCDQPGEVGGCSQGRTCQRLFTKLGDVEAIITACAR